MCLRNLWKCPVDMSSYKCIYEHKLRKQAWIEDVEVELIKAIHGLYIKLEKKVRQKDVDIRDDFQQTQQGDEDEQ